MECFHALKPEKFDGMMEPWRAEQWLREMNLIFKAMECGEMEKRWLAMFHLTYVTVDWWEVEEDTLAEEAVWRMTWAAFKERFLIKYFLLVERNLKKKEFIELV